MKAGLKQKVTHEFREMLVVFLFLAPFFLAFSTYRLILLNEFHVNYFEYGTALINALILSKVILIGELAGLGKRHEEKPLILSTVYKAFLFSLLAAAFRVLEDTLRGLTHGRGWAAAFGDLSSGGWNELLGRTVVMFLAFIPFFALMEVGRVMGEDKLFDLFYRKRAAGESDRSSGTKAA
jgi:hypothetical protein